MSSSLMADIYICRSLTSKAIVLEAASVTQGLHLWLGYKPGRMRWTLDWLAVVTTDWTTASGLTLKDVICCQCYALPEALWISPHPTVSSPWEGGRRQPQLPIPLSRDRVHPSPLSSPSRFLDLGQFPIWATLFPCLLPYFTQVLPPASFPSPHPA